jgi:hypothetical protein
MELEQIGQVWVRPEKKVNLHQEFQSTLKSFAFELLIW